MREKLLLLGVTLAAPALAHDSFDLFDVEAPSHYIEVRATDRKTRSVIADMGYAIDEIRSDAVYFPGDLDDLKKLRSSGLKANAYPFRKDWLQEETFGLLAQRFISTDEVYAKLNQLAQQYPQVASLFSMGKSVENRDILVLRISGKSVADAEASKLPVVLYTGCHHAREHLSVEVPLRFAEYMLQNYGTNPDVTRLLDSRELYVSPLINPDGHKYDYRDGLQGRMWRKNRRRNADGTYGVDLNRNYGFKWGTGGSSNNGSSDVYMGPAPFSEPETQAVKNFVENQPRMKTLLTFHTFSELILYPWGHTYDRIGQGLGRAEDYEIFSKMARDMATWNKYTPQQSSELYIASGDTTDWAYGERGIFAMTFELSPNSMFAGGFYPNPSVIEPTFNANLKPMLYMLEYADNPGRVVHEPRPDFNVTPADVGLGIASFGDLHL